MSLSQGFPNVFGEKQPTNSVLHNLDNETKKLYNDINAFLAANGHAHTGNGSDGAKIAKCDKADNATNADTVDGKHASDFAPAGYGIGGTIKSLTNIDIRTVVDSGRYYCNGCTNTPGGNGFLDVLTGDTNVKYLRYTVYTGATYECQNNGTLSNWSKWKQTATTDQLPIAPGSSPTYACRAWVNFNGVGVVSIRASGNVSSIVDNGAGDYTVNFVTPMPDANYVVAGGGNSVRYPVSCLLKPDTTPTISSFRLLCSGVSGTVWVEDALFATIAVFR